MGDRRGYEGRRVEEMEVRRTMRNEKIIGLNDAKLRGGRR